MYQPVKRPLAFFVFKRIEAAAMCLLGLRRPQI